MIIISKETHLVDIKVLHAKILCLNNFPQGPVLVLSLFREEVTSFQPRAEEAIGP